MPKQKKEKMTIEKLAIMVADGFEKTATKDDFQILDNKIRAVKIDLEGVKTDLDGVKKTVTRIEQKITGGYDARFERIEDSIRQLKVHTKFKTRV